MRDLRFRAALSALGAPDEEKASKKQWWSRVATGFGCSSQASPWLKVRASRHLDILRLMWHERRFRLTLWLILEAGPSTQKGNPH